MSDEKLDTVVASTVSLTGSSVPSGTLTVDSGATLLVASGATKTSAGTKNVTGSVEYKTGSSLKIVPNAGTGKVLTSSADGTATWQAASGGSDWTYTESATGEITLTSGDEGKWFYLGTAGTAFYTLYSDPSNGDRLAFSTARGAGSMGVTYSDKNIEVNNFTVSGGGSRVDSPATSQALIIIFNSTANKWIALSGEGWTSGM